MMQSIALVVLSSSIRAVEQLLNRVEFISFKKDLYWITPKSPNYIFQT